MMRKVDKGSPVPLYYQLKNIIAELIENEELKPGDPVPTERELCELHGISRMTVQKAILALVNEGVVYREQGKGTFVAQSKERHRLLQLAGFTEEMQRRGLKVATELLSFERKLPTKKVQSDLNLSPQDEVFEVERLRLIDGEPYALETVYLPVMLCPALSGEKLKNASLYDVLSREFGLQIGYAYQTIEPVLINDYESNFLHVKKNSLALLFSRHTYLTDDTPFEVTKAIYRSDKYKFEVALSR